MIFVSGVMTFDPAHLTAFARDVKAMVGKVRSEQGCLHYSLLVDDSDAGHVVVTEQWTDDAALIVHLKQPWIVDFLARHGPHLKSSTVKVYDIAGVRPLPSLDP